MLEGVPAQFHGSLTSVKDFFNFRLRMAIYGNQQALTVFQESQCSVKDPHPKHLRFRKDTTFNYNRSLFQST